MMCIVATKEVILLDMLQDELLYKQNLPRNLLFWQLLLLTPKGLATKYKVKDIPCQEDNNNDPKQF